MTQQRPKEDDEYEAYSNLGSNIKEIYANLSCENDLQQTQTSHIREYASNNRPILTSGDDELPAEREHKLNIVRMQFMKHQALSQSSGGRREMSSSEASSSGSCPKRD